MTATLGSSFHVGPDDHPDKYRLLQQVGRGGEAQLWQGELSVAGGAEPVAIKIRSRTEGDFARSAQRWNEQAELLRFIRHPGVVGVREHFEGAHFHLRGQVGEARERALYLVMNWVDGAPLHEWTLQNRDAPDRLTRVVRHLEQVATVLDWLHAGEATPSRRPVIHGDLSPGNVMILPTGQAMLVDFGLVRVVSHRTERAAGTPGYAAPEVWHSGDYSPAADRYAFGAVAWFALTGEAPSPRPDELRARLLGLPLTAGLTPDAAAQLGSIFADRPEQRPQSLLDWMHLLRRGVLSSTSRPTGNGAAGTAPSTWANVPPAVASTVVPPQRPTSPYPAAPSGSPSVPRSTPPAAPRRRRWGRIVGLSAAALVVAMIGGLVLGYRLFGDRTGPTVAGTAPVAPTVAAPRPSPPAAPAADDPASDPSAGGTGAGGTPVEALPGASPTVRRASGANPIRLAGGYAVDIDSLADDWDVKGYYGDLSLGGTTLDVQDGDLSPVDTTTPDYDTCARATTYYGQVDLRNFVAPKSYCLRTSEHRYAFVTVLDATGPVVLDVTVWDPPRPS